MTPGTVATLPVPTSIAKTHNLIAMALSRAIKQFRLYSERAGHFGLTGQGIGTEAPDRASITCTMTIFKMVPTPGKIIA